MRKPSLDYAVQREPRFQPLMLSPFPSTDLSQLEITPPNHGGQFPPFKQVFNSLSQSGAKLFPSRAVQASNCSRHASSHGRRAFTVMLRRRRAKSVGSLVYMVKYSVSKTRKFSNVILDAVVRD